MLTPLPTLSPLLKKMSPGLVPLTVLCTVVVTMSQWGKYRKYLEYRVLFQSTVDPSYLESPPEEDDPGPGSPEGLVHSGGDNVAVGEVRTLSTGTFFRTHVYPPTLSPLLKKMTPALGPLRVL
jgi:hypothetical protein